MNIHIKRVTPNDPEFVSLIDLLNLELWERNPGRQQEYVAHNILAPDNRALVLTANNVPVASGAFRNLGGNTAEIKRMFVKKEYRGKGISKLVLLELETWAKEEGITSTLLETGLNHPEAIGLYKKSGYQRIKNYGPYSDMPESICMGKEF